MAYGGLRGAIAYGLVVALPDIPAKNMFVTSCIVIIYFTVFLQVTSSHSSISMIPGNYPQATGRVPHGREEERPQEEHDRIHLSRSLFSFLNIKIIKLQLIDYTMSGMEDIAGFKGHHWIRDSFTYVNNNYIKPMFVNKKSMKTMDNTKIVRMWKRLQLEDAKGLIKGGGDISKNQVFVQALMEHTRSRSNT